MKFSKLTSLNMIAAAGLTLGLAACDSGSDSSSSTGTLSLGVTDAPVDMADKVVVEFSGVEIKPKNGNSIIFDFTDKCALDPTLCQIDLLSLTNGVSEQLLDGETVPSGEYNWMRLMVNAEPVVRDSYIVIGGSEFELRIPSGAETGLKLNGGFTVPVDGEASYTVDFDLRKSVHDPQGTTDYILRPTLRMMENTQTGTLSGSVDPGFYTSGSCTGAVYVFDSTVLAPDDEDGEGFGPDPVTTALVADNGGVYTYKVGFLTEGDYLIAFTCDAQADDPEVDNDVATVSFPSSASVTITANATEVYNFQP
jgi:hypothetical protein